jgi:hypothetical protein
MSSTVGISIAVLLNRASEQKRVADHQTEDQKDKTRVVCAFISGGSVGTYELIFRRTRRITRVVRGQQVHPYELDAHSWPP